MRRVTPSPEAARTASRGRVAAAIWALAAPYWTGWGMGHRHRTVLRRRHDASSRRPCFRLPGPPRGRRRHPHLPERHSRALGRDRRARNARPLPRGRRCTPGDPHAAKAALSRMAAGKTLRCVQTDTDHYGRTIATCSVGGRDLGDALVAGGWAVERYR